MSLRVNPFPNKTLWEKEKLVTTSNFSFSHSVFYPVIQEVSARFSLNLKLSSFISEESKICCLGKGSYIDFLHLSPHNHVF